MDQTKVTMIDEKTQKNIDAWLSGNYDQSTKAWIQKMQKENEGELQDAFYTTLSFGTGGLRGKMGVGTNRMNIYTIRGATQGLANYLKSQAKKGEILSVLIGFDSRNNSKTFAQEAAAVLAANNIEVYLYEEMRPVALISFGIRHMHCTAGILITASHNPPEYNGYKVYWKDGVQVLPPHDSGIITEVNKIKDFAAIKTAALPNSLIKEVGSEIDKAYLDTLSKMALHPGQNQAQGGALKIVYTPLHGSGITILPEALKEWGFTDVVLVDSQKEPDGNFPTVKVPNPEDHNALKEGINKLKAVKGDILLATDPDADRIAVVAMYNNEPYLFNGNEIGCILCDHICRSLKEAKEMPPKPMFIKTIVTSELFRIIAEHYGALCLDVLTGFKYIGEKISQWEEDPKGHVQSHHFLFGAEESYGYLFGTHVGDKDAIIAADLISEAALIQKLQGKTLVDHLFEIYHRHGVYREKLLSMTFDGKEGMEKIKSIMANLRANPPKMIHGVEVVSMEDYENHTHLYMETGHKEPITLPKSDVIRFFLADNTKIVVRPSGTEPKLKIYCGCMEKHFLTDKKAIERALHDCNRKADTYLEFMKKKFSE